MSKTKQRKNQQQLEENYENHYRKLLWALENDPVSLSLDQYGNKAYPVPIRTYPKPVIPLEDQQLEDCDLEFSLTPDLALKVIHTHFNGQEFEDTDVTVRCWRWLPERAFKMYNFLIAEKEEEEKQDNVEIPLVLLEIKEDKQEHVENEQEEDYSDADEEVAGSGPSGNRKMKKGYKHRKAPVRKEKKPAKTTISRVIGFPDIANTRLQYNDVISLTGTTAQYTFRANSLFDPDFSGTGHQPTYFDQYIATYERYRVLACSISVSVINRSFTDPAMVAIFPVTDVPTITSISQAAEIPRKKITGILPSYQSIPIRRTIKVSTEEQIGLLGSAVYSDDYAALFNANPVTIWYYGLYGWCPTTGGLDVIIDVQLNFDCQFFDRAPSTLSLEEQLARQTKICGDIKLAWLKRSLDKKSK